MQTGLHESSKSDCFILHVESGAWKQGHSAHDGVVLFTSWEAVPVTKVTPCTKCPASKNAPPPQCSLLLLPVASGQPLHIPSFNQQCFQALFTLVRGHGDLSYPEKILKWSLLSWLQLLPLNFKSALSSTLSLGSSLINSNNMTASSPNMLS